MAYKFPYDEEEKEKPRAKLATNRSMWKLMLLNVFTCSIYTIIFFIPFSFDLERIHPSSGRRMNFLFAYILSLFTFSIVIDIWHYQTAKQIREALEARKIDYEFGTGDFWKWLILGSFIIVGPFVYYHKLCRAMNLLCEDYNENPVLTETK